jgi:uncharacterized protein YhaN
MRLARIDAMRYGALEGASLAGLGEGLTVVLGPNESGKSTYTALVRHVLFGFPMGRGKAGERFYRPAAGDRAARLVFADDSGEWAVERVEGARGGSVTISALRGPARPDLLAELMGDLAEPTYRVVFGFGVDELDDIEHGDDQHLAARLYAAGTGLAVSPLDVRDAIEKAAVARFAPRATTSRVNVLAAQIKQTRDAIRGLEGQAADFAEQQARADQLETGLLPLRQRRDELDTHARLLERDIARASQLVVEAEECRRRLDEIVASADDRRREIEARPVDERVARVAADLGSLLEEESGMRQRLDMARGHEVEADSARRRVAELGEVPDAVSDSAENRARVDEWSQRRADLESEVRIARRQAEEADARARGIGTRGAPVSGRGRGGVWVWMITGVGGLFAITGILLGQWLAALMGAIVAIAGGALAVLRPAMGASLLVDADRAAVDARTAEALSESAAAALKAEETTWRAWLKEKSLDSAGDHPAAVRGLLDAARERADATAAAARGAAAAAAERAVVADWGDRLADLCSAFAGAPEKSGPDEALIAAARLRELLEATRVAIEVGARAEEALAALGAESERTQQRLVSAEETIAALAADHGVDSSEPVPVLEPMRLAVTEELAGVRDQIEEVSAELNSLRGRLDAEGRDAAMALARQRMEGLRTAACAEADSHVVDALAVRLLDRARERFERERQPEVARSAGRVFDVMTGGRYTDVRVPLDGGGLSVLAETGALRPTLELSKGTAEQLYLALRIGFLSTVAAGLDLPVLMDDVVVNFDAGRREGAAAAIAQLATGRQVVFFTCHEETADALAIAAPDRTLVTLDRCDLPR